MDHYGLTLDLKTVDTLQRIVTGYAAVHSNIDRVGDIIDPAAFTKTLNEKQPGDVAVFIGHRSDDLPIGRPLSLTVDGKGLRAETYIFPGPMGDQLLQTAKALHDAGDSLGLSIGYRTRGSKLERGLNGKVVRRLTDIDLVEYSFAARQSIANPEARSVGVKAVNYRIEERAGAFVLLDADGEEEGRYATRAAAEAERMRLMRDGDEAETPANRGKQADEDYEHKAIWDTAYINALPDSAFLFVESGGQKDDEGKTVPRSKRHLPYKNAEGAVDLPHLRNAIARIPQMDSFAGLDKGALQGRARRLLANADTGGKTVDVDSPEWQQGAAPQLYALADQLMALADAVAAEQKAMRFLGQDVHNGALIRPEHCLDLDEVASQLKALAGTAKVINEGAVNRGQIDHYQARMRLWDLQPV